MEMELADAWSADYIEARRSDRNSLAVTPSWRTCLVGWLGNRPTRASALPTIVTVARSAVDAKGCPAVPMMTAPPHHGRSGAEIMSDPVDLEPHLRGWRMGGAERTREMCRVIRRVSTQGGREGAVTDCEAQWGESWVPAVRGRSRTRLSLRTR